MKKEINMTIPINPISCAIGATISLTLAIIIIYILNNVSSDFFKIYQSVILTILVVVLIVTAVVLFTHSICLARDNNNKQLFGPIWYPVYAELDKTTQCVSREIIIKQCKNMPPLSIEAFEKLASQFSCCHHNRTEINTILQSFVNKNIVVTPK